MADDLFQTIFTVTSEWTLSSEMRWHLKGERNRSGWPLHTTGDCTALKLTKTSQTWTTVRAFVLLGLPPSCNGPYVEVSGRRKDALSDANKMKAEAYRFVACTTAAKVRMKSRLDTDRERAVEGCMTSANSDRGWHSFPTKKKIAGSAWRRRGGSYPRWWRYGERGRSDDSKRVTERW